MEKASKVAKYAIILGDDEIENNYVSLKNLETSEQTKTSVKELLTVL